MSLYSPLQAYQQTSVDTSSPHRLVLMLYQGCIRRCSEAMDAMQKGEKENAHTCLLKAQDIVAELMSTLDMEAGGEIAQQLLNLYQFAYQRLIDANTKKDPGLITEAVTVIQGLAEAWEAMNTRTAPQMRQAVVNA